MGFGTKANPLFLDKRCCFLSHCTHAVCGVKVRKFPSVSLCFCSNFFRSFTFIAISLFFRLPLVCFLVFGSTCAAVRWNFEFKASFSLDNENPVLKPVLLGLEDVPVSLWKSACIGSGTF